MVGQGTLDPLMMVRIHPSQPIGVVEQRSVQGALNPQTRVQLPATLPFFASQFPFLIDRVKLFLSCM